MWILCDGVTKLVPLDNAKHRLRHNSVPQLAKATVYRTLYLVLILLVMLHTAIG